MATTRTGNFPIGFRQLNTDWQQNLDALIDWTQAEGFEGLDLPATDPADLRKVTDAGLRLGTVDLLAWPELLSPDAGKRSNAVDRNIAHIRATAEAGAERFFTVLLPEDRTRPRAENHEFAVASYSAIADAVADLGVKILIEGYPGGPPHFAALGCNPESYRHILGEVPGRVLGVNYDPSHLVRMFIDPLRFLEEFLPHVHHVHAKGTEIDSEALYEFGCQQPPAFTDTPGWGGPYWRYTIPGHGQIRWGRILAILTDAGYAGMLSIELEDENFNGTEAGEKHGLTASRDYLTAV